jgi:pimeloyl-[acyl-carrier protein] synthase
MSSAVRDVDVDLSQAAKLGNEILAKISRVRELDPIYWSDQNQLWMVTGHREVIEGFRGELPLTNNRWPEMLVGHLSPEEREARFPRLTNSTPSWIVNTDAPVHLRLRRLCVKAFSRPVVEGMRPHARRFIREALDEAGALGDVEFVGTVARMIPARTILQMMGLSDALYPKLHRWSIVMNGALGGIHPPIELLEECEAVIDEQRALFAAEIEARRRNPGEDFVSALVTAQDAGDKLTTEEMLGICHVALIAGHDTTANTLALGTAALAQLPEARQFIRDHPDKCGDAIMELMRYVAMSTTQMRSVAEDFDWRGHHLKKGQFVLLMVAGANRDPKVFPDPERMDMSRPQDQNVTFGPGMHHCIGHLLAKMQLAEFFPELLRRFEPELLQERLDFGHSVGFRSVETLNIRLHPR